MFRAIRQIQSQVIRRFCARPMKQRYAIFSLVCIWALAVSSPLRTPGDWIVLVVAKTSSWLQAFTVSYYRKFFPAPPQGGVVGSFGW